MEPKVFYIEKQKFQQSWINVITSGLLGLSFIVSVIIFLTKDRSLRAAVPFIVALLIFILFKKMELLLKVDGEKISYKFFPFQNKKRVILKSEIKEISVDNYDPILDYGGWGIRFGNKGKAFTTSGSFGLQISFGEKGNILIGTLQPKELYIFLKENNYNPQSNIYD